jgi:phosphoribosylaminoimidazolecarboxamide formyltransferase/IMP cyclohydrolase
MPRALFSVHDKTGVVEFGRELAAMGWEIIASGGTSKALEAAGVAVTPVERVTRHPEMLGGRVKTLHPAIHGAILARDLESDFEELKAQGYAPISMVVSSLYPFEKTIAAPDVTLEEAIEQIDIGGITLLRAAAKNFARVAIVCDPADYAPILAELKASAQIGIETRRRLAVKAFKQTRDYDTAIHAYLADGLPENIPETLPESLSISLHRVGDALRYGENPHQKAALYSFEPQRGPFGGRVLGGKELSYNNILDIDAAWRAVASWDDPTVVIVKHLTPCGIGTAATIAEAYKLAFASDPMSAFGCVMAVNRLVDDAFVEALGDLFIEVIVAPEFSESAQHTLNTKRKNCRLLAVPSNTPAALEYRSVSGGVLVQTSDAGDPDTTQWRVVTKRQPTEDELTALRYAWTAVQHVKSNAIVIAVKNATIGVGGGVSNRVDAARLAVEKAGEKAKGAALASDAFFPFPDSLEVGLNAGVTAVIQPGGALRDKDVIAAADAAGITMILTGVRHFRH